MFRNFLCKVRFWLIKKLGGYPYPNTVSRVEVGTLDFEEIHSTMTIGINEHFPIFEVEKILAQQIADLICERKLFYMDSSINFHTGDVMYRMDVLVRNYRTES